MRTNEKPFKSLFSELYIDAPNYLAEFICKRNAEKENSGTLPEKFWNIPKYKSIYIREVSQARNLLKTYDARAIIGALDSWESKWIMSLRNRKLIPIIEKHQKKIKETEFIEEEIKEISKPKPFGQNKLGEL